MTKLSILLIALVFSIPAFAFEMGSYHNKEASEATGCWIEVLSNTTSIKADGHCYTEQGMSYNILGLVRMNYGLYEYKFEMDGELFVNKIVVSKELLSFKIYNVETNEMVQDEYLKYINDNQVQYYLSYFDFRGDRDVRFDITLYREVE